MADGDSSLMCGCPACAAAREAGFTPSHTGAADAADGSGAAAAAGAPVSYVDALLNPYDYKWGSATPGVGATISYSFLSSVPGYYGTSAGERNNFVAMNSAQVTAALTALQFYSEIANLTFTAASGTGSITFGTADLGNGIGGWAYYPYPGYAGSSDGTPMGDVWITNRYSSYSNPTPGTWAYQTFLHEIGHALGLKHPGNYNAGGGGTDGPYLPTAQDNHQYTVMSYYSGPSYDGVEPMTLQLYDIAAIQYLYGANMSTRSGDTTYTFTTSLQVKTIWDGGGTDTFDASNQLAGVRIDLHAGAFSSIAGTNNIAIAYGATIEQAIGSNYNDTLIGGDGGAVLNGGNGNDNLFGGAGADLLAGSAGNDVLTGGGGADRFIFLSAAGGADQITDFVRGTDVIALSAAGFGLGATGALANAGVAMVIGGAATSGAPTVLFDASTNSVKWDSDGTGGAAATTLATVTIGGGSVSAIGSTIGWNVIGSGDLNADGTTDLVWRAASGQTLGWLMSNGGVAGTVSYGGTAGWNLTAHGDFNGDGTDDLLWQDASGMTAAWLMVNGGIGSVAVYGSTAGWQLGTVGDFDSNGTDDLLWRTAAGDTASWLMTNGHISSVHGYGQLAGWNVVGSGDYNADGSTDLMWQHSSGTTAAWLMYGGQPGVSAVFGQIAGWSLIASGDINNDGTTDLLWRSTDGLTVGWHMAGGRPSVHVYGDTTGWDVVASGDMNSDGNSDFLWRHSSGQTIAWLMSGGAIVSAASQGSMAGLTLVASGDFAHDGSDDLLWRDASASQTGIWSTGVDTLHASDFILI